MPDAKAGGLGTGTIFIGVDAGGHAAQFRFAAADNYRPNTTEPGGNEAVSITAARLTDTVELTGAMLGPDGRLVVDLLPNAAPVFDSVAYDTAVLTLTGEGGLRLRGGGALTLNGDNRYAGGTLIDDATLTLLTDTAAGTGHIVFRDGPQTLELGAGVRIANIIEGFGAGDRLVLDDFAAVTVTLGADHTLRIRDASGAALSLRMDGNLEADGLALTRSTDAEGNTTITAQQRVENGLPTPDPIPHSGYLEVGSWRLADPLVGSVEEAFQLGNVHMALTVERANDPADLLTLPWAKR